MAAAGWTTSASGILCEELERADTAFRVVMSVHVGLNSLTLLQWGSEDQKQRFLVPQARGEKLATFGLTEPGVGTDAAAPHDDGPPRRRRLRPQRRQDLDQPGATWPTTSWSSRRSIERSSHKGITAFIVERGMDGFSTGTIKGKLGIHAGNTGQLFFDDVRVPVANRVGEEGEGFTIAMSAIDQGRFTVATGAVGLAQACLDASVTYAHERQTFGEEIGRAPARQADAGPTWRQGIEAGRLLCCQAAWLKNRGRRNTRETSLAKWFCTDHAVQSALDAIQVHGAYGYSNEYPVERYLRNARRPSSTRAPASCTPSSRPTTCSAIGGQAVALPAAPGAGLRGRVTFVADPPAPPGWSASDIAALARAFDGFVAGDAERMARHGAAALDELAEPFDRWQLKLALRAFDLRLANLALGAGAVRYRDLDDAARDRYLLGWGTSRFSQRRTTFQALKRLALFLAYADPGSGPEANRRWAPMGYRPRWETPTTEPSPVEPLEVDRSGGAPGGVLDLEADIVIVGSGAGGGVVAARAAAAGRSVLVVEAGSAWPEATMPTDELTGFKRMFLARGLSANADLSVAILAGSTLGGGMTVNWTTSIDAPPAVREHWTRDHGLEGFDGPDTTPTSPV